MDVNLGIGNLSLLMTAFVSVICCLWLFQFRSPRSRKLLPPGPRGIGTTFKFISAAKKFRLHLYAHEWAKEYGSIVSLSVFNQTIIFLNSADAVKECFCNADLKFITNDRPSTFATSFVFKDCNIGFSDIGSHHTKLRRLVQRSMKFVGEQSCEKMIQDELQKVVTKLEKTSGEIFDLGDFVSATLLNIIHMLLTNTSCENDQTLKEMQEYNDAINKLFDVAMDQPLTLFPILRRIPGPFKTTCDTIEAKQEMIFHLIFDKMKDRYSPGEKFGLIQAALETQCNLGNEVALTDDHIRFLSVELISAGYFTSKGAVLGILLVLMEKPDLQEKLYNDIYNTIGGRLVSIHDRSALPSIDVLLVEALRYLAHGPTSIPHTNHQEIELRGYRIPKDSIIFTNLWTMGHDEKIWDHPWDFQADRFLDDNGHIFPATHPIQQQYFPFGIGKRQCPGEVFAKNRIFMLIVTLIQHFRFLSPEGGMTAHSDPRTWLPGIILLPGAIKCRVAIRETKSCSSTH